MSNTEPLDIDELQIDTLEFRLIGKISIGHKHATSQFTTSRLLIVSNKYGFSLIGRPDSFLFIPTNQLVRFTLDNKQDTSAFQKVMVPSDGSIGLQTLSLSCDELTVGVVVGSKVMLFDVRGISKGDTKSFKTYSFSDTIQDCVWSTSNPSVFLAITSSGKLISYDINNDSKQDLLPQNVSACTWNSEGNNILVGHEDASISIFSYPAMNKVLSIPKPENDPPFVKAKYVQYAMNNTILVGYSYGEDSVPLIIHVIGKNSPKKYQLFQMPGDEPVENTFYSFPLPEWNVVVCGASNSSEIEVLGIPPNDSEWKRFALEDDARPQLPLTASDDYTMLRGMCLDFTNTTLVRNSRNQDSVNTAEFTVPILIFLTNDGVVCTYYFVKTDAGGSHSFMKSAQPIPAPIARASSAPSFAPEAAKLPVFAPPTDANKPSFAFPAPGTDSKGPIFAPPPSSSGAPAKTPSFTSSTSTDSKTPFSFPPPSDKPSFAFPAPTTGANAPTATKPTDIKPTEPKPTFSFPPLSDSKGPAAKTPSFSFNGTAPLSDSKTPSFSFPSSNGPAFASTPDALKPQTLSPLPTMPSAQPPSQPPLVVVGEDTPRHKVAARKSRDDSLVTSLTQPPSSQQLPLQTAPSFQKQPSMAAPTTATPSVFKSVITNVDKQAATGQPSTSAVPPPATTKDIGIQIDSKIDSFNTTLLDLRNKKTSYMKQIEAILNGTAAGFNKPTLDKLKESTEELVKRVQALSKTQMEATKLKDSLYLGYIEVLRQAVTIQSLLADKNDAGYKHLLSARKLDTRSEKLQKQLRNKNQEISKVMDTISFHLDQLMIQYKPFLKAQHDHSRQTSSSVAKSPTQTQAPLSVSMSLQPGRSMFQTAQKTSKRNGSAPTSPATPSLLARKNSPTQSPTQAGPILDTICRTLENHFVIIRNQSAVVDDLVKQLDELRVSRPLRRPPRGTPRTPSVPPSPMRIDESSSIPTTPVRPSFGTPRTPSSQPSPQTVTVRENLSHLHLLLQERAKKNNQVIQPINKIAVTPSPRPTVSRAPSGLAAAPVTPPKTLTSTASSPIQFTPAKVQTPPLVTTPPLASFTPPANNIFNVTKPSQPPPDTTFRISDVLASEQEFEIKSKTRSPVSALPQIANAADRNSRFKANRESTTHHKREFSAEDSTPAILRQQQPTFPTISQQSFASPISSKTSESPLRTVQSRLDLSKLDSEEPEEEEEGYLDDENENDPDYEDEEQEEDEEEYEVPKTPPRTSGTSKAETKPAFAFGSFGTETTSSSSTAKPFSFSGGSTSTPPTFSASTTTKPTDTGASKAFSFGTPTPLAATKEDKPDELAVSKNETADASQKSAFAPPSADKKPLFSADSSSAFKPRTTSSATASDSKTETKPIFSAPSGTSFSFGVPPSTSDTKLIPAFGASTTSTDTKDSKAESKASTIPVSVGATDKSAADKPAFGATPAAATKTDSKPSFSFETAASTPSTSTEKPTAEKPAFGTSLSATEASKTEAKPSFSFGSSSGTTSTTTTAFGFPSFTATSAEKPGFGISPATTAEKPSTDKPPFGTSTSTDAKADTKPSFSFGSTTFGASTDKPASFNFGSPATNKTDSPAFGATSTPSSVFGAKPVSTTTASAFGASTTPSPIASTSTTASSFGSTPPAFGTTTPSTTSTSPSFGTSSTTATPAFGSTSTTTPAFGTSTVSAPAFGSTSFGASTTTPATSTAPAFGSSTAPGFGASTTTSTPAFGTTSFGSSTTGSFGSTTTPSTGSFGSKTATPAFGSSTTAPAFGSSTAPSFGASTAPSFGASASTSEQPSFGFGSMGLGGATPATASKNPFGGSLPSATTSVPAFGSSSFGSSTSTPSSGVLNPPSFGSPSFGTQPSTTTAPTFGGSAFTAPAPSTSPFTAPTTPSTTPFGSTSAPSFGQPSFGQPSFAQPAFGSTSFGASTPAPAFGTTASPSKVFGSTSTPGTTSGFGAFASTPTTGFGSFGQQPSAPAPSFGTTSGAPSFGSTGNNDLWAPRK